LAAAWRVSAACFKVKLLFHCSKGLSTPHKTDRRQMASTPPPLEALRAAVAKKALLSISCLIMASSISEWAKRRPETQDLEFLSWLVHFWPLQAPLMKHWRPEKTAKLFHQVELMDLKNEPLFRDVKSSPPPPSPPPQLQVAQGISCE
jgi:hypothetical protein